MDYICRSNIIEISGEGRIVTELGIELPTYPSRDQMSVSLISSVTSASSVLERDVGLSLTILDERSFEFGREVFRNSGFNIGEILILMSTH
ncbi:hypothetical protein YC2023_076320 [Brassica napus]